MNQKIVDYLQENKEKYSKESLVANLKGARYDEVEIQEAVSFVYGDKNIPLPTLKSPKQSGVINQQSQQYDSVINKKVLIMVGIVILIGIMGVLSYIVINKSKNNKDAVCAGSDCELQDQQLNIKENSLDISKQGDVSSVASDNDQYTININGVNFVPDKSEQTPPGGMVYEYLPKQDSIDQRITINILKRPMSSVKTNEMYKKIAIGPGGLEILDEWKDEAKDEYGFYGSKYDNIESKTTYTISNVIDNGSFQISMRGVIVGEVKKNNINKIIGDFRKATARLSRDSTFQNDFSNQKIIDVDNKVSTSKQSVLFNFDDFDFIVDEEASNYLSTKSDEIMYIPTSQTVRPYEESGFLITTSIPVRYKQASEVCNDLKSSMEQLATGNTEIKDIKFHNDEVCGVYLYEKDNNNEKINLWFKVSFADNKMYKYIINSYGEGLSLEIVAGVTEEFKEFKY